MKERKEAKISWLFFGVSACLIPPVAYGLWELVSGTRWQNIPLDLGVDYLLAVFSVSVNTIGLAVESNKQVGERKTTLLVGIIASVFAVICWGVYTRLVGTEENYIGKEFIIWRWVAVASVLLVIDAALGLIIKKWTFNEKEKGQDF